MTSIKTDVIATFQENKQMNFKVLQNIDLTKSLLEIENLWVASCVEKIKFHDLTKLSLYIENGEDTIMRDICNISYGKYFFQPDQRGLLENQIIQQYPDVAKDTSSYKDWLESIKEEETAE